MEALNKIERSLGAPIVIDAFSYPYYDHINEEDPFLGLAEKISASPYLEIERSQNEYFLKLAKKYRVNGVILLLPMGCRVWYGFSRMIEDSFKDLGIPTLHLDVDTVDSRQYSDSQAKTRVEAFVESLLNRQHG
jgi:benzoyl-CoA reductase/2-hydroxyglutaryl-CoA dehydratase subunit BcrC/BadD/HgdB